MPQMNNKQTKRQAKCTYINIHSLRVRNNIGRIQDKLIPEAEVSYNYDQKLLASHGSAVKTVSHT